MPRIEDIKQHIYVSEKLNGWPTPLKCISNGRGESLSSYLHFHFAVAPMNVSRWSRLIYSHLISSSEAFFRIVRLPKQFLALFSIFVHVGKIPYLRQVLLNSRLHFNLVTLAETFSMSQTEFRRSDGTMQQHRHKWSSDSLIRCATRFFVLIADFCFSFFCRWL